jgi:hypothetical protein
MSYRIQNLLTTRNDPFRSRKLPIIARKPIVIGARIVRPGETITISDAFYERSKARINEYVRAKAITAKYFLAQLESVGQEAGEWVPDSDTETAASTEVDMDAESTDLEVAVDEVPAEEEPVVVAVPEKEAHKPEEDKKQAVEKEPAVSGLDALLSAPAKRFKKEK